MNKEEIIRNKIYVSSPTSISIGYVTWFDMDTKLVGRIDALIKENKQLKEQMQNTYDTSQDLLSEMQQRIDKAIEYINSKYINEYDTILTYYEIETLLEILKGDKE